MGIGSKLGMPGGLLSAELALGVLSIAGTSRLQLFSIPPMVRVLGFASKSIYSGQSEIARLQPTSICQIWKSGWEFVCSDSNSVGNVFVCPCVHSYKCIDSSFSHTNRAKSPRCGGDMETARAVSNSNDIYFCDDPRGIELITRKDLPKQFWNEIRNLQQLDTRWNWRILFFYSLWGLCGFLMLNFPHWGVQICCTLVIGFCIYGAPGMMHESSHSLLSKNASVNRWLGFISGLPGLVSISAYRSIHSYHHAHTRSASDPDSIEDSAPRSVPLVVAYFIVLFFGIYVYIVTVAVNGYKKASHEMRSQILFEYGLMAAIITGAFAALPARVVEELWVYPLLVAAQLTNVRGLAEHGMTTGGNPFTDTRTVISNKVVAFFMCNLNYHLEHHLFPGIPCYNLPKLHDLLKSTYPKVAASVYRSYTAFLIDFVRVVSKGVVPNFRLIPNHIREEYCG